MNPRVHYMVVRCTNRVGANTVPGGSSQYQGFHMEDVC